MDTTATVEPTATSQVVQVQPEESVVEQDLLVEDVSIDGMCGVY